MSRQVTQKIVQVHESCACGWNSVDSEVMPIRYKDFKAVSISRRRDKKAGGFFFLQRLSYDTCFNCKPEIND